MKNIAGIVVAGAALAQAAVVKVDPSARYQTYDGTGISEAFQRSLLLHKLDTAHQNEALDLLFTEKGAGFTILRNGLGSSPNQPFDLMKSITPKAPASDDSELNFIPLPRDDQYQVWLSKQARARGVNYIYADAWSADGYMKTNDTDTYGGYLCGVYNTSEACGGEDWRQSYADKIVRYIQDYANHGIHIDYVGFLNEPDLSTPYASMQSSGCQAADFIKVLHPSLQQAGLTTAIACCDGSGWEEQRARLTGIQRYHQEKNLGLVTSHGYSSYPGAPFNTDLKVWQTEWSTFDNVNYKWYTPGGSESDGITWANNIRNTFADSNVNGFLYWWGAAEKTDNEMLIFINHTNIVRPTKRLWAHAHFGNKFVRQNAVRIDATSASSSLNVTAFENTDSSVAVQVINNSNKTESLTLEYPGLSGCRVDTYLTNEEYDLEPGVARLNRRKDVAVASVPGQSLLTFYVVQ